MKKQGLPDRATERNTFFHPTTMIRREGWCLLLSLCSATPPYVRLGDSCLVSPSFFQVHGQIRVLPGPPTATGKGDLAHPPWFVPTFGRGYKAGHIWEGI